LTALSLGAGAKRALHSLTALAAMVIVSFFSILQLALDCVMTVVTVIYDTSSMETIMDMPYM
jgi:hypothetical protein